MIINQYTLVFPVDHSSTINLTQILPINMKLYETN